MSKNQSQLRVAVLWHDTVVSETLVDGRAVTIGEDVKNTLMIPDVANVGSKYVLFSPDRDGYTLHLSEQMTGKVQLGGKETDVAEARKGKGKDLAISGKDWGMLDLGPLAIFFQFVDDRAAVPVRPIWGTLDAPVLGSLLTALTPAPA